MKVKKLVKAFWPSARDVEIFALPHTCHVFCCKTDKESVVEIRTYIIVIASAKSFTLAILVAVVSISQDVSLPAQAQEREWSLDRTDQDAFLVFGTPSTDDVGASFWCRIGSNSVRFYLPVSTPLTKKQVRIELRVSGKVYALGAKPPEDAFDEKNTLQAEFPVEGAIARKIGEADFFSVTALNHTQSFPLGNADFVTLFRLCRTKPASN